MPSKLLSVFNFGIRTSIPHLENIAISDICMKVIFIVMYSIVFEANFVFHVSNNLSALATERRGGPAADALGHDSSNHQRRSMTVN